MAKGTKITARFSDGTELTRTTTLDLTHAWQFKGIRTVEAAEPWGGKRNVMLTGFAGSREKAQKALASEPRRITKDGGEVTSTEIVEVMQAT